jgi:hypothetical protein
MATNAPARTRRPATLVSLVALAGLVLVTSSQLPTAGVAQPPPGAINNWSMADLLRHAQSRGLRLHPTPTGLGRPLHRNAFFSERDTTWDRLNVLPKDPAAIARWAGVVYCERVTELGVTEEEVESWGEYALAIGPFVFFGDPELLARLRAAFPAES